MTKKIIAAGDPGKCRVCGCSELKPCLFQFRPGEPLMACSWIDAGRTLCSNLQCIAQVPLDELMELVSEAA